MCALGSGLGCRTAPPPATQRAGQVPPSGEHATGEQHLFRVEVERKGAFDPSFRLVLRQEGGERFDLSATDPFGRSLWRVEVDDGIGRFQDDREHWACRFDPSAVSAVPRLDWGLAAIDLPAVLLARVGAASGNGLPDGGSVGPFEFSDRQGRRWSGESDGAGVVWWSLETPTGRLDYRRGPAGATLVDERSSTKIRWRELSAEALAGSLRSLADDAGGLPECSDADLS